MVEWIEVVGKVGFPVAIALWLLWQGKEDKKELKADKENLEGRFDGLEKFCREDLKAISESSIALNEKCVEAIKDNTDVVIKNTKSFEETQKVLQECKLYLANNSRN